jgi:hypothetical protein
MGYDVTLLPWQDTEYTPDKIYDAVFSLINFLNCKEGIGDKTKKILRMSMSDPAYHNEVVTERTEYVNVKRGSKLEVHRLLPDARHTHEAIDMADKVLMNGNDVIAATYPEHLRDKLTHINVPASDIGNTPVRHTIPARREFLWHFGSGSIHKGLDLCLDVFKKHPELTLHIVGKLDPDFAKEFEHELSMPNIHHHGWMLVSSQAFQNLLKNMFAFVAPSCSEGQSPAVATCLQLGLYPIISKQTGIDLPVGCGAYLEGITEADVERAVLKAMDMTDDQLLSEIEIIQPEALVKHSRAAYKATMQKYLSEVL